MISTEAAQLRAAQAQETKERKQRDCENEFGLKRHRFVKINKASAYDGKVGRIQSYNDLRDKDHPSIPVEVGVVFFPGQGQHPSWFLPYQLEYAKEPANWGK